MSQTNELSFSVLGTAIAASQDFEFNMPIGIYMLDLQAVFDGITNLAILAHMRTPGGQFGACVGPSESPPVVQTIINTPSQGSFRMPLVMADRLAAGSGAASPFPYFGGGLTIFRVNVTGTPGSSAVIRGWVSKMN